jgi:phage-related minor tail protein
VILNADNIGGTGDTVLWYAYKDGVEVAADLTDAQRTLTMNSSGEFTTPINVDGGYDSLTITTLTGDFSISGFSYIVEGETQDINLTFGYTATDADGDAVSGSFTATLSANDTTALSTSPMDINQLLSPDSGIDS